MRWKFGVSIGPPNVLVAPKPTSSVRIKRTLGAPAGASMPFGKSGVEPFRVRSMWPLKGGSGGGNTLGVWATAGRQSEADATAEAAIRMQSRRRRLDFLSDRCSPIVFLLEPCRLIVLEYVCLAIVAPSLSGKLPGISVYQDRDSPEGGMSCPCPLMGWSGRAPALIPLLHIYRFQMESLVSTIGIFFPSFILVLVGAPLLARHRGDPN